ncbi:MAG TPA: glycosyltransferase 87 family protein [Pilimelia sp.]|nr:glycosyltransferase 87 family protein [Pilimelia sp.]
MPATVARRPNRIARVRHGLARRAGTRADRRRLLLRLLVLVAAGYGALYAIDAFGRPYNFFDMRIYRGAVLWWTGGGDLYEFIAPGTTLGFTYPPFAALTMLPIGLLSTRAAGVVNVVASLVALGVVLAGLLGPMAARYGWSRWFAVALAVPLAAAIEPVRESLGYGQVNLLLFALVIADVIGLRWRARGGRRPRRTAAEPAPGDGERAAAPAPAGAPGDLLGALRGRLVRLWLSGAWAGAGIGLATAVKLTPALFILYLVVTRQWRPALTAVSTAVGVTLGTFLVAGRESVAYFGGVMWQTDRVGAADFTPNQSLAGLLARLYDSVETPGLMWLAFALLMLAVGLTRAANAHAEGDELAAFTLVGLTANVISPISWSHHLVFVVPAVLILVDAALRRRVASRGLAARSLAAARAGALSRAGLGSLVGGADGLRTPIWYPALTGLRHATAALALYALFLVAPIWRYEHQLQHGVSHYADGLLGALAENSLALALIVLVAALPWRPGAEPAFGAQQPRRLRGS